MNLNYTIQELAQIVDGEIINEKEIIINQIFIDSRNFFGENDMLFIAIKGPSNNGHEYIKKLIKEGCSSFIIDKKHVNVIDQETTFIVVEDTIEALQKIAKHHRSKFSFPVIGITGSNGKTIVKE